MNVCETQFHNVAQIKEISQANYIFTYLNISGLVWAHTLLYYSLFSTAQPDLEITKVRERIIRVAYTLVLPDIDNVIMLFLLYSKL